MIEVLYKKIIFILLSYSLILSNQNDKVNYINTDFISHQESKTSIGVNLYDDSKIIHSYFINNWFSNNLYAQSYVTPKNINDNISIQYNILIGYVHDFNFKSFKNITFGLGYNRSRMNKELYNNKSLLYSIFLNFKFKKVWLTTSLGIIDDTINYKRYSCNILRSIREKYLINFGFKLIMDNKEKKLISPYMSLGYKL